MPVDQSDLATLPSFPWPPRDPATDAALQQLISDGGWGRYHGPHVAALQAALQSQLQREFVALCCSGTAAVELCLRALNVGSGDEVILTAYDFKANLVNVLSVGGSPVLVDCDNQQPRPDVSRIVHALTPRTKAVVVSHLHGCHAPMRDLMQALQQAGVAVIEDVCQNPGAMVDGRLAGMWGDLAAFSFGGSKLLTAGRGGAVVTSDSGLHQRIRLYTQRGNDAYPLSEMQAAVLLPQLRQLEARNRQREQAVVQIERCLDACRDLQVLRAESSPASHPAFYKLAIQVLSSGDRSQLDRISALARQRGVAVDPAFTALHLTHGRSRYRSCGTFENAERFHHQLLTLHHPVLLGGESHLRPLCAILQSALSESTR